MFARLFFLGIMVSVLTLPIGILADGAVAYALTGTGSLTLASTVAGTVARAFRVFRVTR